MDERVDVGSGPSPVGEPPPTVAALVAMSAAARPAAGRVYRSGASAPPGLSSVGSARGESRVDASRVDASRVRPPRVQPVLAEPGAEADGVAAPLPGWPWEQSAGPVRSALAAKDDGGPATAAAESPATSTGEAAAGQDRLLARLAGSAFDPGRSGLRALAAVAAVVVLGAGLLAWWSRPQPEPVVPRLATEAPGLATPTTAAELVVAVTGLVHRPGLVRLPPGARVADAIEAAGGLLPEAEIDHLNLARRLTDGELIAVGVDPPPDGSVGGGEAAPGAGPGPGAGGKVNLNTATVTELQVLPGIGPALAQRIIDHRSQHGPFSSVDQLRQVSGIGEVRFAELRDLVTV